MFGVQEKEKLEPVIYFFFYTLVGSIFMLLGITYIYVNVGSTSYELVLAYDFSLTERTWLWFFSFFIFSFKNANVSISYLVTRSSC